MDANLNVRRAGNVAVAVLHGEYDLSNIAALRTELVEVLRSRPSGIVLDLAEVEFCDLACLRTMANIGRRAAAMGIWVRAAGPTPMIRRMLDITGLCAALPTYPDVEFALRGQRGRVPAGRAIGEAIDPDQPARRKTLSAAATRDEG